MAYLLAMLLVFLFTCGPVTSVSDQVITQELFDYLFTNYTKYLLPTCRNAPQVTLKMDIALRQIIELNEPEQILTTNVWMRLNWNDCRLTWDPASFDNLTYITVMYTNIWTPDLSLYDSAADSDTMFPGRKEYRAYISSSGSVYYNFPTIMISICGVNVKYFPFDTQTCTLQFGSWSHHGLELDITSKNPKGDTDVFIPNNEWVIEDFPVERHVLYYNCCPEPYPDVTFYVILKRLPMFYALTMLFPCVLVTFVSGLTFLLPTESGEKVSLEITVLLSLSVFLLLVSEQLPPSSDNFPIVGIYFATSMVLVTMSLVQTVIVVNVFHRGKNGRKVPQLVRVIFFKFIGRVLCAKRGRREKTHPWDSGQSGITHVEDINIKIPNSHDSDMDHNENNNYSNHRHSSNNSTVLIDGNGELHYNVVKDTGNAVQVMQDQLRTLKSMEQLARESSADADITEWIDISNIIDRLFLVVYSLVSIITTVVFLVQMTSPEDA